MANARKRHLGIATGSATLAFLAVLSWRVCYTFVGGSLLETSHAPQFWRAAPRGDKVVRRSVASPSEHEEAFSNMLEALRSLPLSCVPANKRHSAGTLPGQRNYGFTLGLTYDYGARLSLPSKATRNWPELTAALCRECRRCIPDFRFTSIQVNLNTKYSMHHDGYDAGASYFVTLGNFSKGRLWVHNSETDTWKVTDAHNHWIPFDGREYHFNEEWEGPERYSLVFFTHPGWRGGEGVVPGTKLWKGKEIRPDDDQQGAQRVLEELGFPWPTSGDVFSTEKPDSDARRVAAEKSLERALSLTSQSVAP
eukprot:TRINITY_DN122945_c0_g1_i1.p1 TRINITY_DN122945_c0_g1~~TRINITY_DN122945_c0_g1_i1.p1  ORF type:complete len:309 (-),score=15.29 TRINITY_DN122945_c0_g1_i1:574-1500(-)